MTKDVLKYLQPNAVIPIDMETTTALVNALKERLAQPEQEPEFPFGRIKATVTGPGPYKNHYPACANCNLAYATNLADDCGWACDGVNLFSKRNNMNDKETT
jgi:hypothetical protein